MTSEPTPDAPKAPASAASDPATLFSPEVTGEAAEALREAMHRWNDADGGPLFAPGVIAATSYPLAAIVLRSPGVRREVEAAAKWAAARATRETAEYYIRQVGALQSGAASLDEELAAADADSDLAREEARRLAAALETAERRLAAVEAVCAATVWEAKRWEHPLETPGWVAEVRAALSGAAP